MSRCIFSTWNTAKNFFENLSSSSCDQALGPGILNLLNVMPVEDVTGCMKEEPGEVSNSRPPR